MPAVCVYVCIYLVAPFRLGMYPQWQRKLGKELRLYTAIHTYIYVHMYIHNRKQMIIKTVMTNIRKIYNKVEKVYEFEIGRIA